MEEVLFLLIKKRRVGRLIIGKPAKKPIQTLSTTVMEHD
jgi:hypothetical protein